MKVLRFDSVGGASGDMILGALVGLGVSPEFLEKEIRKLIPTEHFHFHIDTKTSFGATGIHLTVELEEHDARHLHFDDNAKDTDSKGNLSLCFHDEDENSRHCHEGTSHHCHGETSHHCHGETSHHCHGGVSRHCSRGDGGNHHGRTYADIRSLLESCDLDPLAKGDALASFAALAKAESEAHQTPIEKVHFHEIGATDSIIDTVGCSVGFRALGASGISLSPLPVGEGTFTCAHGVYPLPAPAVAILMRDYALPISYDVERCEMLTPTAASLFAIWKKVDIADGAKLVATVNSFGSREMKTRPNLLRVSLYEVEDIAACSCEKTLAYCDETVLELSANIDDSTGESLAAASSALFASGALDVWFEPIYMKKGRPAWRVSALCGTEKRSALLKTFFRHTGTFGVRESIKRRFSLERRWEEVVLSYGVVRMKIGFSKTGEILSFAPEYDDCLALAERACVPYEQIYREAITAYLSHR